MNSVNFVVDMMIRVYLCASPPRAGVVGMLDSYNLFHRFMRQLKVSPLQRVWKTIILGMKSKDNQGGE